MIQARGPHFALRLDCLNAKHRGNPWKISIPKRVVRLATARNRWRRRIREILRLRAQGLFKRYQLSAHVHTSDNLSYPEIETEILQLIKKSGVKS